MPKSKKSSDEKIKYGRRKVRQAKKAKRLAERERDCARKERDDAQDKCKELEKKVHDLVEENRNCKAIRQVTAAAVKASIEVITNREEERRPATEQERDDAVKKLLEAEKRTEALKNAARDAVRLTLGFHAWRIRALIKAKKVAVPQKESNNNRDDGPTLLEKVAMTGKETVKAEPEDTPNDNSRKRTSTTGAPEVQRRRTDSIKPSAEELNQKFDAILGGYSEHVAEKYKLFFVENLRSNVRIEELGEFVRLRCPSHADIANKILKSFSGSP